MTTAAPEPGTQLGMLRSLPGVAHHFETRDTRLEDHLPAPIARPRQVHGDEVIHLYRSDDIDACRGPKAGRPAADGLITRVPDLSVAVATADCLPVLVADPKRRAVAAIHAGWRGVALGILPAALGAMAREFGTAPDSVVVGIGAAVGPCCYPVGDDVVRAFEAAGIADAAFGSGSWPPEARCDLGAAAVEQLRRSGVAAARIESIGVCTACTPDYYHSYRRDADRAGRQLAGIALLRT